ncbi:MAG: histidine--tRNA ligase [Flavobacteriales bacterium]|nr:histidine--tRNA ligase [Flavobacteriales bacterium]
MAQKPSIPKGTRDFSPQEMLRRKYIFSTIERVFQKYGFLPLETPAMENLETLTGKYGEEGDRLIFKVLNSGDFMQDVKEKFDAKYGAGAAAANDDVVRDMRSMIAEVKASQVTEKALRYDLTVPFARYVVQHQSEIAFPFKRYQIQPVWRADRPQKGRYREFYQCDADVIGSKSLISEVELVQMFDDVFTDLGLQVVVKINNRKVLQGAAELCGCPDKVKEIAIAIDKVDKIGREKVEEELLLAGMDKEGLEVLLNCIFPSEDDLVFYSSAAEAAEQNGWTLQEGEFAMQMQNGPYRRDMGILNCLNSWFEDPPNDRAPIESGMMGTHEVFKVYEMLLSNELKSVKVQFDTSLARGLDYYTGAIFEVKALEGSLQSSICGGGRYDDLTGIFGLKNMSGVGISFGADRIYDVLLETNKFPAELGGSTKLLFANFGEKEAMHCLKLLRTVREAGVAAELYPDAVKMAKQFKYADDKNIAFVAIIGENELKQGIVTIKDMKTGEQKAVKQEELLSVVG